MMKLARERAHDLLGEIKPLLQAHYREIASDQDIPLEPDIPLYCAMEDGGILRCYTVRDDSGALIGYAIFILRQNPHYKSSKQAVQDVLYVTPSKRGARVGLSLIHFSEDQLRADGVQLVYHHCKAAHPALGGLLKHAGYELREFQFAKRLDKPEPKRRRIAQAEAQEA